MAKKILSYILYIIAFVALWTLVSFLTSKYISQTEYTFKATSLVFPTVLAAVTGYFSILKKKDGSSKDDDD